MTELEKQSLLATNDAFQNRIRAALSALALSANTTYQSKGASASPNEIARAQCAQRLMQGGLETSLVNLCRLTAADTTVSNASAIPESGDTAQMTCTATDAQIATAVAAAFDTLALPVRSAAG